ncbi:MAG TPA: methyl-accepting chemotaxis protein [Cerasibacillus sp.]|uniref:methyl-accepting chemotaxis protein n=1 Tax=Cerasibacillus sp. TaxID=2498711 RepID=UPI002F3F9E60
MKKEQKKTGGLLSFYKKSLQNQIIIPFIILILFTGGAISFVSYYFSVNNTTEELSKNVEVQMESLNDTFQLFFTNVENILNRYTENDLFVEYDADKKKDIVAYLLETQEAHDEIGHLYTGTETGDVLPQGDLDDDYVAKDRPWYKEAVEAEGEVVWSDAYEDVETKRMVVTASKAYYNGNELVGVMAADIFIDTVVDLVKDIRIGETGYAVIYDTEGKWITHVEEEKIGRDESQKSYYKEMMELGEQGTVEFNVDQKEFVIGFVKNPTLDWILAGAANKVDFKKQAQTIFVPILISLVIIIAIAVSVSLYIARKITRSIRSVMERMTLIAAGDLSQPPLEKKSEDEIGELVQSTNDMNENMRQLLYEINMVATTVSSQSEELTQSAGEVKAGSEQISSTMQELASGSETQAHSTADLSSMMQSFASDINELHKNGDDIHDFSEGITVATDEGSELMRASKEQMDKIDQVVHDAVLKVQGLDVQSQEISKLVGVIQDVADQTNLLALNAAIEAARAGEHGRGFAVVADEVRKLAEQVSESVVEITDIVENIQAESSTVATALQSGYQEVEAGTNQIEETGKKFDGINESIIEMADIITSVRDKLTGIMGQSQEMNGSIEDIAAVAEEAAAGIEETSASSEQSSASMEEVTQSSQELAKLAEQLNGLVQQFKL